jgi:hypothetical protein
MLCRTLDSARPAGYARRRSDQGDVRGTGDEMEYGMSLLLENRLLLAREVDYDDCRSLQLVCPACHEPLHKRGNPFTRRQYLSHYEAKGKSDCELRVFNIVRDTLHPVVVVPHGQELERFLARFEEIVLEAGGVTAAAMMAMVQSMRVRKTFRELLRVSRDHHRVACCDGVAGTSGARTTPLVEQFEMNPEMTECARSVVRFLTSPNAFSALMFAVSYGLALFYTAHHAPALVRWADADNEKAPMRFPELVELSDRSLPRWFNGLDSETRTWALLDMATAICETAGQFVVAVTATHRREDGADALPAMARKAKPQNEIERQFVRLVERARTRIKAGPIPGFLPRGIEMTDPDTGAIVCDLADDDYLLKFRQHVAKRGV